MARFRSATRYFNTFASSPLQAAGGMTVLDVIDREQLEQNSAVVGLGLKEELQKRSVDRDWIGDVWGQGLFVEIEMVKDGAGLEPDVARTIDVVNRLKDDAREFLVAFDETLAEVDARA